ncbi:MBL fold metallo-hydrolase [Hymenobacter sp. BT507]|uniref:MBL fold metallo-hydrolase n=1 Tax=Hymenobacter citatus TaxID=2763506 RepID=A0ABR7MQC5_9BACT|nr:MBL fold metallo-hydrolase [Hymenobacter citatus]MBC6613267.1 MBL fold metallo-hydrolase [Hymenobacter citatus]
MQQVAPGVHQLTIQRFVNLYFVETGTPGEWVLVDTGLPGSEKAIIEAADKLFYPGTHPEAIILTHGHMDHAGSAQALSEHWNVPVLAHPLELPFLTGKAVYPPADPTVEGGGSLAFVSRFFPPQSFNLPNVQALPDNDIDPPFLPDWQWYHVPGHAPGQVALFREKDRTLIGGDAFATANHESVPSLLLQRPCISVAGAPFNYDWQQVRDSVRQLAELQPQAIGCGHGPVITGLEATMGLQRLADEFPLPLYGRYAYTPARLDENGVAHLPAAPPDQLPKKLIAVAGASVLALGLTFLFDKKKKKAKRAKPESPTHKTPKKFRRQSARTWE